MEKSAEQTKAPAHPREIPFYNRVLRVIAYPASLLMGMWTAGSELHNATRQKLGDIPGNPWFGELEKKFDVDSAALTRKAMEGKISGPEYSRQLNILKELTSDAAVHQMERAGYGEGWMGARNIEKKWTFVNRGHRQQAVTNGLAATGVTLGVLLTVAQSHSLKELLGFETAERER
ncbi:MAG: hypothetical protein SFX19_06005 [Alphaproteobacteria bacterium]|nr:hypothetical protein [Alphaproteobacteria bacterium]